ncbi:MAG TPA: helix-turn-helix transcriptional regulator, partial [Propionibacteriaceae bacterium]|nr:helix-turn-helix transcriptional regulator [Propionibacteriaceae bacterium]
MAERDKTIDQLLQAREAFDRRDWALAFDSLRNASDLGPQDTLTMATAAYLLGDADEAIRTLQAGYQDRIKNADALGAVRFACWLGMVLNTRGEVAVGGGWIARAHRLLETEPEDIVE